MMLQTSKASRFEISAVLSHVVRPSDEFQVVEHVVQRVAVLMVDDHPLRDRAVGGRPHDAGTELPRVRLSDLHEGSDRSIATESALSHRPERRTVGGVTPGFEFGRGRTPDAALALVPRHHRKRPLGGLQAKTVLVAASPQPVRGALMLRKARQGTEPASLGAIPINLERGEAIPADQTHFRHAVNLAISPTNSSVRAGACTTLGVAHALGRRAIGGELYEKNAALAGQRIDIVRTEMVEYLRERGDDKRAAAVTLEQRAARHAGDVTSADVGPLFARST